MHFYKYKIRCADGSDRNLWDDYVCKHPQANLFHLYGWREVIRKTYGHKTHYLMAYETKENIKPTFSVEPQDSGEKIVGVVPLVHIKHIIFGNNLVSLPFLDGGGILADNEAAEENLLSEIITYARQIGAARIELRHKQPLLCWDGLNALSVEGSARPPQLAVGSHKVRMLLDLPESSEMLMKTFKSKLRSQIKKPIKAGLTSRIGNTDLLKDFYKVFSFNMRDLGSPVHSKKLMENVLNEFPEQSKIINVYKEKEPIASSLVIGFNEILFNPWASFLRKYSFISPNMLLYLRMLEYGCDQGYRVFDFGRSSVDAGTYKFKAQWGATPTPLYWYFISFENEKIDWDNSKKGVFDKAIQYWKVLPLPVTKMIGPSIRKYIIL